MCQRGAKSLCTADASCDVSDWHQVILIQAMQKCRWPGCEVHPVIARHITQSRPSMCSLPRFQGLEYTKSWWPILLRLWSDTWASVVHVSGSAVLPFPCLILGAPHASSQKGNLYNSVARSGWIWVANSLRTYECTGSSGCDGSPGLQAHDPIHHTVYVVHAVTSVGGLPLVDVWCGNTHYHALDGH